MSSEQSYQRPGEPRIEQRAARSYVGIRVRVTLAGFPAAVDQAFPELFGWLDDHGAALTGAPFIRYHETGETEFEIELAVPVDAGVAGDGRVQAGVLPAGRYVTLRHVGPFDGLIAAHEAVQRWAQQQGITLDNWDTDRGCGWGSCSEHYLVDPSAAPDPAKWEVELAYLSTGR